MSVGSWGQSQMQAPQPRFCHECGAGNAPHAQQCFACHLPLLPLEAEDSSPAMPVVSAPPMLQAVAVATTAPAAPLTAGTLLRGRYRIVREIGQGGFSTVYLARDLKRRRARVAIKQISIANLSARDSIEATDTFNREVTLLSRLTHRSLPRIHDHFADAGHWYMVMDYIAGQTLEDARQARPAQAMPLGEVVAIGLQLCDVLAYLHAQNPPVIFRDLKPSNVVLTRRGRVCLIDFGIARRFVAGRARDTRPLGSPGYAAPEQYGSAQTTVRSDIYSLRATLQTLLSGKEPLDCPCGDASASASLPPTRRRQKLQRLLERMLEREGGKRPQSMREVQDRLEEISPAVRVRRFLKGFLLGFLPWILPTISIVITSWSTSASLPPILAILLTPVLWLPLILSYALVILSLATMFIGPIFLAVLHIIIAFVRLLTPRKRLLGLGMLVGLAIGLPLFCVYAFDPMLTGFLS